MKIIQEWRPRGIAKLAGDQSLAEIAAKADHRQNGEDHSECAVGLTGR